MAAHLGSGIAIGDDLKRLAGNDRGAAIAAVGTGGRSNWLANGVNAAKPTLDHRQSESVSQSGSSLVESDIRGDRVIVSSNGDINQVGGKLFGTHGVNFLAGNNIDLRAGYESHSNQQDSQSSGHGFSTVKTDGRLHIAGPNYNQDEAGHNSSDARSQGSRISSELGQVTLTAGQQINLQGAQLDAGSDIHLTGTKLVLGGRQESSQTHDQAEAGTFVGKMRDGHQQDQQDLSIHYGQLNAGGQIHLTGQQIELGAIHLNGKQGTQFHTSQLTLTGETSSRYHNRDDWDKDRGYEAVKGEGSYHENLHLARIDGSGGIQTSEGAQIRTHLDNQQAGAQAGQAASAEQLRNLASQLASEPGLGYLGQLAQRPDIDWQGIATAHRDWDYKGQGLTQEGAIVLTAVVAILTYGAGSAAVGTTTATAGGAAGGGAAVASTTTLGGVTLSTTSVAGLTSYTAAGAALNAGLTTLATTTAVSLANNGGDLGKTLGDLGSSDTVRNVVSSMLTAGALNAQLLDVGGKVQSLNQLANVSTLPGVGSIGQFNSTALGQTALGIAGRSIVSAGISSAIQGSDFKESLINGLVGDLSAVGANAIGSQWGSGVNQNVVLQTLAHGALGCAAAEARGGDCRSGAAGGLTESLLGNVIDQVGGVPDSRLGNMLYTVGALVGAGVIADELDLDESDAMHAAQNSASNNYLSHRENQARLAAEKDCAAGDSAACETHRTLVQLDKQRNADFHAACDGQSSSALCRAATEDMRDTLATFADPTVKLNIKGGQVSPEELTAHRTELQSYVPLIAVGDKTVFNNPSTSRIPTEYNADPYAVLAPEENGLYVTAKFGNEWLAVGSTKGVFTDYGGLNGIQNKPDYAPGLIGAHVNSVNASAGLYTLYYTPTHGFLMDGLLTFADKFGFTTSDARNFAKVLENVQASGREVSWVAHSRGGVTFTEGARVAEGNDLSRNWVVYHAGANNRESTAEILGDKKIKLGDQDRKGVTFYRDSPYDAVPNIIGLNGSPIDMVKSFIALPLLFGGPELSPHTMPYQPSAPSTASRVGTPSFLSLLGNAP